MPNRALHDKRRYWRAFEEDEVPIRRRNYQICALATTLFIPAGMGLDYFAYDAERMWLFFPARVVSSLCMLAIWFGLRYSTSGKMVRLWGLACGLPPNFAIAWMIHYNGGAESPYYAGMNLILVGAALLMRWSTADSAIIVMFTLLSYGLACLGVDISGNRGILANNLYFLAITGVMTILGTWIYTGVRFNEFMLRRRLNEKSSELLEANSQLEERKRQLEDRKTELEESNLKLRELDETKSRFFANVSHELRTPLTLLIAPVETFMARKKELSDEEANELLATMHSNAMRLLKLINDLLDLVRLESGTIQIRRAPLALEEFVRGLGNAVTGVAKDKRIQLKVECEPGLGRVQADKDKLERICLNLLFNALKFTPAGGTVSLHATKEESWLRLEVRDTGVGIAPEDLGQIFSRFWQADTSSQRKYQGMGIGLSLVKEIAEAHGGSVAVASERGKGTTMTVLLPYEEADEVEVEAEEVPGELEPAAEKEWISDLYRRAEMFPAMTSLQASLKPVEVGVGLRGKKPKLLIADDEPDMLRFLRNQLSSQFEVLEAVDGHQAVVKAAQFLPEIILSDMMMPEKDGLQVCRELREKASTKNIPIVLLTARADEKTKIDCLLAGASDFLAKPFSLTELSVRLKNLADSHNYQRELLAQKLRLEAALEQIKETEAMLVRNEKLASLGRLSAGLIHEINNPLNYAKQGLYVLRSTAAQLVESERAEYMETLSDIENGVDRVARIIADLRGFSRTTHEMGALFHLRPAVETTLRFFSAAFKEGVAVEVEISDVIEVRGDRNQFVQVLINLIQNALDAMSEKTYPEDGGRTLCLHATQDEYATRLHVRDNGPGIPPDIQQQIFDPFFTTKDVGSGMGLGLSICHQIIAEHGGRILLESVPGEFCEFVLEFPAVSSIFEN